MRTTAIIPCAIWSHLPDDPLAQWLYARWATDETLTAAGTTRWSTPRRATTDPRVDEATAALAATRVVVVDESTDEVLLTRHLEDARVVAGPNLSVALAQAWHRIGSPTLRGVVTATVQRFHGSHPDLSGWHHPRSGPLLAELLRADPVHVESLTPWTPRATQQPATPQPPAARPAPRPARQPQQTLPVDTPVRRQGTRPTRPPAPNPADATNAGQLVAGWLENLKGDLRPPDRVVGQVSREVRSLLEQRFAPDVIAKALIDLTAKQLHPGTLQSLAWDAKRSKDATSSVPAAWRFLEQPGVPA